MKINIFLKLAIRWDRRDERNSFSGFWREWREASVVLLSNQLLTAFRRCQCSFLLVVRATSSNYCFQLNNSRHSLPREKNDLGHSYAAAPHSHSNSVYSDGQGHYRVLIAAPSCDGSDYFFNIPEKWKGKIYTWEIHVGVFNKELKCR